MQLFFDPSAEKLVTTYINFQTDNYIIIICKSSIDKILLLGVTILTILLKVKLKATNVLTLGVNAATL